jgi:hypothetical protein
MTRIEKRLLLLEKRLTPTPATEATRQLLASLDAGRDRARAAYQALGLRQPSEDEPELPAIPEGAFNCMTITQTQIYLLQRGRERNHLRWLEANTVLKVA